VPTLINNILVGKPEGKSPRERPSSKWGDKIVKNLIEKGWKIVGRCMWLRLGASGRLM
jgi:hypothetical protein